MFIHGLINSIANQLFIIPIISLIHIQKLNLYEWQSILLLYLTVGAFKDYKYKNGNKDSLHNMACRYN